MHVARRSRLLIAVPLKYVCALSHACWPIRTPTSCPTVISSREMNAALDARESGLLRRLAEGRERDRRLDSRDPRLNASKTEFGWNIRLREYRENSYRPAGKQSQDRGAGARKYRMT